MVAQFAETESVANRLNCPSVTDANSKLYGHPETEYFEPSYPTPRNRLPGHARIIYQLYKNPIELLTHEHYTRAIVVNKMLGMRAVFLNDPNHIRRVFITDRQTYGIDPIRKLLLRKNFQQGLACVEGTEWHEIRGLTASHFTGGRLQKYADEISRIASDFCQQQPNVRSASLVDVINEIALNCSMRCLFSAKDTGSFSTLQDTNAQYLEHGMSLDVMDILRMPAKLPRILKRSLGSLGRRHRTIVGDLYRSRAELVETNNGAPDDLLTGICQHYMQKSDAKLGHSAALDNVGTMLGAAYDTTSKTISWAIYLLVNSPDVLNSVRAEIDAGLHDNLPPHKWAEVLPLVQASVRETLRLYPAIPGTARYALANTCLGGQAIRKGDFIIANIWVLHRSARFWKNATRFEPERFLAGRCEKQNAQHFMPFGIGPRSCVGRHFAELEAVIVLATLLRNFDFTYMGAGDPQPVWKGTLRSSNGIPVMMSRRD